MTQFVTRLDRNHQLDLFDSGHPELDAWLRTTARSNDRRYHTAAVWVLCDDDIDGGATPIGYSTLSTHAVAFIDVAAHGLPQARQWPDPVPAVLLGRLAIDKTCQGQSLGTRLLRDAVDKVLAMQPYVNAVLLVVDAIDDRVVAFYSKRGFTPITERRLVARIKDLHHHLRPQ